MSAAEPAGAPGGTPAEPDVADLISRVSFTPEGLVPAIAQDAENGEVLMMAWMNAESLERTLRSGEATYYSRSRAALWRKGETSGNTQAVQRISVDCDGDTLLLSVIQRGPACHTGTRSCFTGRELHAPNPAPTTPAPTTPGGDDA